MRKALAVCLFELKRTFKKPIAFIIMLAMPLVFILIFGSIFGGKADNRIHIALVDLDQSVLSKQLTSKLSESDLIDYLKVKETEAKKKLKQNDIQAILIIEKGFAKTLIEEQNSNVAFQHDPSLTMAPQIKQTVSQEILNIQIQAISAEAVDVFGSKHWNDTFNKAVEENAQDQSPATKTIIKSASADDEQLLGVNYSSAGFSIMFVMIMMLSVTGILIEARKIGIWPRLLTAPIAKSQIMFGYLMAFFLIGLVQFSLLMISSSLLFDVHWGNPLGVLVLVTALILCIVGLGLMIASFVKTTEQQSAVGTLVIVSTCMIGGVYWPLDIVPKFMQTLANFVPQAWAMEGFTTLMAEGGTVTDILVPVAVLLGFSLLFLVIGLSRVRSN